MLRWVAKDVVIIIIIIIIKGIYIAQVRKGHECRCGQATPDDRVPIFVYSIHAIFFVTVTSAQCLQCFDAVGWAAGRASGL